MEGPAAVDGQHAREFAVAHVSQRAPVLRDAAADYAGHVGGASERLCKVRGCGGDPGADGGGRADVDDGGEDRGWGFGGESRGGGVLAEELGGEGL